MDKNTKQFETTKGIKVTLQAVSKYFIEKMQTQAQESLPEPPFYTAETIGGGEEKIAHTSDTLKTDEDKKNWEQYQSESKKIADDVGGKVIKYIATQGIRFGNLNTEYEEWLELCSDWGVKISDKKSEMRLDFLMQYIFLDEGEFLECIAEIMGLSGTDKEAVAIIKASFRSAVQEAEAAQVQAKGQ